MKADEGTKQFRSDLQGDSVRMGIAEGAEAHVMDIMTRMYGDPILACVREYSTNALDSHTEAGQSRPIEVSLPTTFDQSLQIRDYGVGLDRQGIYELYSQYGASSKRQTNAAQGMLGIGCKSALAYADQFTVVGFKDGTRTQVVVSRDQDGAATQHIVDESQGDYEDGVEVTIPVRPHDIGDFNEKAAYLYSFWPEKSVLVDDEYPRRVGQYKTGEEDADGGEYHNIWLDDRTLLTNEVDQDLVVMGYVAYPLVEGMDTLWQADRNQGRRVYDYAKGRYIYTGGVHAVCFVDIGEVNFAPSREQLMQTKRTDTKLAQLRQHVKAEFDRSIRDQIAAAPDAKTAQELLVSGRAMGFDDKARPATWQGKDVMLRLARGQKDAQGNPKAFYADREDAASCLKYTYLIANAGTYTRKNGDRQAYFDLTDVNKWTIFTGFTTKWLTNVKRAKQELWASKNGVTLGRCLYVDKLTKVEKFWLDGWPVYDWADVEATELPKATAADGTTVRLKGSYDGYVNGQTVTGLAAHKIDTTKPLYYVHGKLWVGKSSWAVRTGAIDISNATLICLARNRIEKFARDFPMAKEINEAAKEAAQAWVKTIDSEQVKAHAVKDSNEAKTLQSLADEDFDDPSLNTLTRLSRTDDTNYRKGLDKFSTWVAASETSAVRNLIGKVKEHYPLVPWNNYFSKLSTKEKEHAVLYINAVYAAKKGA